MFGNSIRRLALMRGRHAAAYSADQLLRRDGFRQDARCPGGSIVRPRESGHDDDGNLARVRLARDFLEHCIPVDQGQTQVENDTSECRHIPALTGASGIGVLTCSRPIPISMQSPYSRAQVTGDVGEEAKRIDRASRTWGSVSRCCSLGRRR